VTAPASSTLRVVTFPEVLKAFDRLLDTVVDAGRGHRIVDAAAAAASTLGDHGFLWFVIGLVRGGLSRDRRLPAARAIAYSGLITPVVNTAMKTLVDRKRPEGVHADLPLPVRPPRSASFPSGHTMAAWCAATLLAEDDTLAPLYYGLATMVSWSRVHVRAHHASDVAGGALVGIAVGQLGRRILR
jgi:undecaprenyl-diphosphatase